MADLGVAAGAHAEGGEGATGRPVLRWTSVISGFILRRFVDLVGEVVKTYKGFKVVHLGRVAKALIEFINLEVIGQQVYNHLRKWCARCVKVSKLKQLSVSLWDEGAGTCLCPDE